MLLVLLLCHLQTSLLSRRFWIAFVNFYLIRFTFVHGCAMLWRYSLLIRQRIGWQFVPTEANQQRQGRYNVIQGRKNVKKGFDRSVDRSVELGLGLCFQQNVYGGWGSG
jgi:hypothetical protein